VRVIPPFRPHPLLRGGHAQTLAGVFLPSDERLAGTRTHVVHLADGDAVVVHDDVPAGWAPGDPAALLVHGLTGDHQSGYMVRIAARLVARGVRTFRKDARGWGAGERLARRPANAGRSDDVRVVLHTIATLCPGSDLAVAGFSLGANMVLKMLGEAPDALPRALRRAVAVNAPIDLHASLCAMETGANRIYDAYFTRMLLRHVAHLRRSVPDLDWPDPEFAPRSLRAFDDTYTAPLSGYRGAADYYAQASSKPFLAGIRTPTVLLTAEDDPIVPPAMLPPRPPSPAITLHRAPGGGHLGYIAADRGGDSGRRWMDARVAHWLAGV